MTKKHTRASHGADRNPAIMLAATQLNIVTVIDVAGAVRTDTLENNAALVDNSGSSTNKGTSNLRTYCQQGQALNWLIYCMDQQKRPDGTWPPFARISNIVFLHDDGTARSNQLCINLKVYGGPDAMRSPWTPVYYYWAGMLRPELEPGVYKYRLIIECDTEDPDKKKYFELDGPSLEVVAMDQANAA